MRHWIQCMVIILVAGICNKAEAQILQDDALKAGYLVNFIQFIYWNKTTSESIEIGILGSENIASKTREIANVRSAGNSRQPINVISIQPGDSIPPVDILYIAASNSVPWEEIRISAAKKPFLLASDQEDFLAKGGMIQFVTVKNRLRFSVNYSAAKEAGFRFSSKLLNLALKIR